MKIMIKLLLLALVGGLVAPMFIKGPDGRPLMSWQEFFSAPSGGMGSKPSSVSSDKTTVYKWKDEHGQWHFSDKKDEHLEQETVKYDPNANIIQSIPVTKDTQNARVTPLAKKLNAPTTPSLTTVPMAEVPELIDQAKQYQGLIDDRNKALEQYKSR
jgi:hypothetical protein